MSIIDLASLKPNNFKESGVKGVQVTVGGSDTVNVSNYNILDERANGWTTENAELHLWKIEMVEGKPKPLAHLATYAAGAWLKVVLVSEL